MLQATKREGREGREGKPFGQHFDSLSFQQCLHSGAQGLVSELPHQLLTLPAAQAWHCGSQLSEILRGQTRKAQGEEAGTHDHSVAVVVHSQLVRLQECGVATLDKSKTSTTCASATSRPLRADVALGRHFRRRSAFGSAIEVGQQ